MGVQTCAPSSACDFIVYGFRLSTGVFLGFFFRRLCRILSHHFLECGQIVGHHCVMNPERLFGLPFPHSTPSPHVHFKTFLHPNPFVPVETSPSELLFCARLFGLDLTSSIWILVVPLLSLGFPCPAHLRAVLAKPIKPIKACSQRGHVLPLARSLLRAPLYLRVIKAESPWLISSVYIFSSAGLLQAWFVQ